MSQAGSLIPIHTHANKDVIDKFSVDKDGNLLYNGEKIKTDIKISKKDGNSIELLEDGLFVGQQVYTDAEIKKAVDDLWSVYYNSVIFPYGNVPFSVFIEGDASIEIDDKMQFNIPNANTGIMIAFTQKIDFSKYTHLDIEFENCVGPVVIVVTSEVVSTIDYKVYNRDEVRLLNATANSTYYHAKIDYERVKKEPAYLSLMVTKQSKIYNSACITADNIVKIKKVSLV